MTNTPQPMSEELEDMLFKLIKDVSSETEAYIESKGRLIRLPMKARTQPIIDLVSKHQDQYTLTKQLEARLDELQHVYDTDALYFYDNHDEPSRVGKRLKLLKAKLASNESKLDEESRLH